MKHLLIAIFIFSSIEIFIRSNYIKLVRSIIKLSDKSLKIILNKKISDHWKEYTIPIYSVQIIKYSVQILLIILLIILILLCLNYYFIGLIDFLLSSSGIIEFVLVAFIYTYFRKLILQ